MYFYSWTDSADNSNTVCYDGDKVLNLTDADSITLYAYWREGYPVNFDVNGGDYPIEPTIKFKGVGLYLGEYAATKYGQTLAGWKYMKAGASDYYDENSYDFIEANGFYNENRSTTFIAVWDSIPLLADDECHITYYENSNGQYIGDDLSDPDIITLQDRRHILVYDRFKFQSFSACCGP